MQSVLVTGANGFIGKALCRSLLNTGITTRAAVRRDEAISELPAGADAVVVDPYSTESWLEALIGVDVVVHLIALTHEAAETHRDDADAFTAINVGITNHLLGAVAESDVASFIYMSSIKAVGEESELGKPLTEADPLRPEDNYGRSKADAESLVADHARAASFSYTIIRPPVVYGRGGAGNMQKLASLVRKGIPLPLGSVTNQRSIIHVDNLVDAATSILRSPQAANQVFHVADPYPLSTPAIIRAIADGMGKEARLFRFPVSLLRVAGGATKRSADIRKLTRSLEVSTDHIAETVGWVAPVASQISIANTVR